MDPATPESSTKALTREQQVLLARLECATDRFLAAQRLSRQSAFTVLESVAQNGSLIRAGLTLASPLLPRPLRWMVWVFRLLPLARQE